MEEAPEKVKESSHFAHTNGIECNVQLVKLLSMQFLTFICLTASTLSYDIAHRKVRS
jgi:hypothetical protein